VIEALRNITDDFSLTYKEIKKSKELTVAPLQELDSEEIQEIIRV
jgi:hypothetical protein